MTERILKAAGYWAVGMVTVLFLLLCVIGVFMLIASIIGVKAALGFLVVGVACGPMLVMLGEYVLEVMEDM